ncbi:TonB-dependent receptor [Cellulophaga sp. F20128]|uniref:SusC/RagA family TonB-linked outer membrane protein n=1 Tax=Cellulophaga sp. F20128 TaxID=2926413 RepID=UPI001FF12803|nr:TonB-dependent receptor [Cellulophaga sp. F20128]MCK0157045.1 TonB-dependent receptor [Cellulophaga sp. F20128]
MKKITNSIYLKPINDNKKYLLLIKFCFLFISSSIVSANVFNRTHIDNERNIYMQFALQGTVTTENGTPLLGASIIEKGTSNGTQTDFDGRFSLETRTGNSTLIVSYVGYVTQEIVVNNKTSIKIQLIENTNALDEVVLVGYGTKKLTSVTTAVSSVNIEELGNVTTQNIASALQGRVPGLFIRDAGYNKGLSVLVRGATTIGNNSPLYIVDGIPQDLLKVDPNDIEAVSVLKGGAASAIYGARAAAGVILVTTKSGANKKATFNFETFTSWGELTTVQKGANSLDSADIMNVASINSNGNPAFTAADIAKFSGAYDPNYANTNWQDEILKTEVTNRYFLSATAGGEKTSYYFSLGHRASDGIMKTGIDRKQYNLRTNLKTELRDNIDLGVNLSYNITNNTSPSLSIDAIYNHMNVIAPWAGVRESLEPGAKYNHFANSGTYARGFWNPLWELEAGTSNTKTKTFTANTSLTWEIINGLKAIGRYSLISNTSRGVSSTFKGSTTGGAPWVSDVNSQSQTWSDNNQYNAQTLLTYDKTFGIHNLSVLAGWDVQFNKDSWISGSRRNFQFDNLLTELSAPNSGDNDDITGLGSNTGESALQSALGRFNYDFDEKYFLELSARYDGSSNFAPETRYGFFPSASAAWMISKEDFFTSNAIDNLKFRASIGQIGNNRVNGSYFSNISFGSYYFGAGDIVGSTASEGGIPFRNLKWETTTTTNFGVDFSVDNGIIAGSLDYYIKNTDDILLGSPVPGTVGTYRSGPAINAGSVKNNGVELVISHRNTLSNGLNYGVSFNGTYNKNEITELTDAFSEFNTSYRVGDALGTVYGYQADGLLTSQTEVDAYKAAITSGISGSTAMGDIKYIDQNGDNKLDFEDRIAIAETIPKITYGMNLNANWKNFDFQMFFQGTGKSREHKINDLFGNFSWIPEEAGDAWSADNVDGSYPRLFLFGQQTYNQNFSTTSSFWTFNSSYLRLKNLQLGYTIPIKENNYINKARIYFAGTNLLTWSDFRPGFDPESQGLDIPPVKTFSLGVNINF